MKTALLHYWLTNRRGGENVFREICEMFPDGAIFTHAYNPAVMDAVLSPQPPAPNSAFESCEVLKLSLCSQSR